MNQSNPFTGVLHFCCVGDMLSEEGLPPAGVLLKRLPVRIQPYNAPYLAGRTANEPHHGIVRLLADQPLGSAAPSLLPQDWSEADTLSVIGDISQTLKETSEVIIAQTTDFKRAGEFAEKMGGFHPAMAGEFVQLLWLLQQSKGQYTGFFDCYAGRKPGYAISAEYYRHLTPSIPTIVFDNHIGNAIEEGYVSANMDTYCFFVRG